MECSPQNCASCNRDVQFIKCIVGIWNPSFHADVLYFLIGETCDSTVTYSAQACNEEDTQAPTWLEIDLQNFEVNFLISLDWNNIKSLTFIYMELFGRTKIVLQITFFST